MREFDVCGLGNAVVDIFLEVSDSEFQSLGFERGTMRLVDKAEQEKLFSQFHGKHDLKLVSGGSVANSIIGLGRNSATSSSQRVHRLRWRRPLWFALRRRVRATEDRHGQSNTSRRDNGHLLGHHYTGC